MGRHFLLQCIKVKSESEVTQSCGTPSDPMDCSRQAPPSMGFSRHEYWSRVPLPSPGLTLHPCKEQVCSCFLQVVHRSLESSVLLLQMQVTSYTMLPKHALPRALQAAKERPDRRSASSLPPLGRNLWSVPSTLRIQVASSQVCSHQPPQALLP